MRPHVSPGIYIGCIYLPVGDAVKQFSKGFMAIYTTPLPRHQVYESSHHSTASTAFDIFSFFSLIVMLPVQSGN
jgi:hypothetical protein